MGRARVYKGFARATVARTMDVQKSRSVPFFLSQKKAIKIRMQGIPSSIERIADQNRELSAMAIFRGTLNLFSLFQRQAII